MSLIPYKITAIRSDDDGSNKNIVPFASVSILTQAGAVASVFLNSGGTVLSNPFTLDANGERTVWVEPGIYQTSISGGAYFSTFISSATSEDFSTAEKTKLSRALSTPVGEAAPAILPNIAGRQVRYAWFDAEGNLSAKTYQNVLSDVAGIANENDTTKDSALAIVLAGAGRDSTAVRNVLNVADGATANATNAELRDRATHTGTQAISTVTGLVAALDAKLDDSQLRTSLASPDNSSVPSTLAVADAIANINKGQNYRGLWNSLTNTPPIVSSTGVAGDFYDVGVPSTGVTTIDGISDWPEGSKIIFNGSIWEKNLAPNVRSVDGRTGDVILNYDTPAQSALASLPVGAKYSTKGAVTVGDGGHSDFIVEAASGTPDGYSRVLLANGNHAVLQPVNGGVNAAQFGFVGNGTLSDTNKVNLAIEYVNSIGGGSVRITKPGTYLVTNTNPYNSSDWGGVSEIDANWWANRRAISIQHDNISLELGSGVIIKLAPSANCHAIQFGQFPLGIGVTENIVSNSHVIGRGWAIDMSSASQTPATATKDHPAGIISFYGNGLSWGGGKIIDSAYYGTAVEGDAASLDGAKNCHIYDLEIENCKADGFDAKDFATASSGNVIERVKVKNCGSGGNDFLSPQAGVDVRGGWRVLFCDIIYDDAFTGSRVGCRSQYAPDFAESENPSLFLSCTVVGNGRNAETVAYRLSGKGGRAIDCSGASMSEIYRISSPSTVVISPEADDANIAFRFTTDSGAGWGASNSQVVAGKIGGVDTAWRVDATVTGVNIDGGILTSATTPLVNSGSIRISKVAGFNTSASVLASIPVNTTGIKNVSVAHGLPVTPALSDISLSLQYASADDFTIGNLMVVSADATNVNLRANVTAASISGSVSARVRVDALR